MTLFVLLFHLVMLNPEFNGPQSSTPNVDKQASFITINVKCAVPA